MNREPLSRAEFDRRCAILEDRFPTLSQTSGRRSHARNRRVGGSAASKHLSGMAKDYAHDGGEDVPADDEAAILRFAVEDLGLWALWHGEGGGFHLHVQGLPTGPPVVET